MKTVPSEFSADSVTLFLAVEMFFDSGTVRLWNGNYDVDIGANEFIGAGDLLAISEVSEDGEVSAKGVTVTVSGLDPSIVAIAQTEQYQNRRLNVLFGAITDAGEFQKYTLFSGRMDVMTIKESADSSSVQITAENRLIDLNRPRIVRYTSEEQKALFPGDTGFDFVADLQDKQINWGRE